MDSNSPSSEVIDPQHAADNVSAHAIKDQDLPNGITIFVQDGCGDETSLSRRVMRAIICGACVMVEVQKLLNGSYTDPLVIQLRQGRGICHVV